MILNDLKNFNFLNEKVVKSRSVFPKTPFITGNLTYAIKSVAAALTPPELEKKSIDNPNKKLKSKKLESNFFTGYKKINKI